MSLQFLNYFTNYPDYLFTECELPVDFVQTKRIKQTIKSILKYNEQYLRARSGNILCLNFATTGF